MGNNKLKTTKLTVEEKMEALIASYNKWRPLSCIDKVKKDNPGKTPLQVLNDSFKNIESDYREKSKISPDFWKIRYYGK